LAMRRHDRAISFWGCYFASRLVLAACGLLAIIFVLD
jgi:hypothetical protein